MARSGSDSSGVELGGDPESDTTLPSSPWEPGDDRNAGRWRRGRRRGPGGWVGAGASGGGMSAVVLIIGFAVLPPPLSQLGSCDIDLSGLGEIGGVDPPA